MPFNSKLAIIFMSFLTLSIRGRYWKANVSSKPIVCLTYFDLVGAAYFIEGQSCHISCMRRKKLRYGDIWCINIYGLKYCRIMLNTAVIDQILHYFGDFYASLILYCIIATDCVLLRLALIFVIYIFRFDNYEHSKTWYKK